MPRRRRRPRSGGVLAGPGGAARRPRRPPRAERRRRAHRSGGGAAAADPEPDRAAGARPRRPRRRLAAGATPGPAQRPHRLDLRRAHPVDLDPVADRRLTGGAARSSSPATAASSAASRRSSARRRPRPRAAPSSSKRRSDSRRARRALRSPWRPAPAPNVLQEFDGGPGQIALHGTDHLSGALGTAASHGCIRLAPRAIAWLASRIGAGVPVSIVRSVR